MLKFFKDMIQQGSEWAFVDGMLLMENPKHHVQQMIKHLNDIAATRKLWTEPPKKYFSGVQL